MTLNAKNAKYIREEDREDDVEHWDVSETSRAGTKITRRGYFTPDTELERLVEAGYGSPARVAQVVWIFEGTDYERAARGVLAFAEMFIEKFYADRGYSAQLMGAQRDAAKDSNQPGKPALGMVFTTISNSVGDAELQRLPDQLAAGVNELLRDVQSDLSVPVAPDPEYIPASELPS